MALNIDWSNETAKNFGWTNRETIVSYVLKTT